MAKLKAFSNRVIGAFAALLVGVQPIAAQIVTTPISGNTSVYDSANGVPIVNIETPNGQGVSHNIYGDFNVGPEGLIFNNSDQNFVNTQLGGQIYGNANLTNGTASVILNEVVYNNPSELLGYMEVAGARADIIIANPYGVTCNGCGFINTDHAMITSGTPFYTNGVFQGFNVTRGTVAIGEMGLDASGVSQFDILSRQIDVGGVIYGQSVTLIAGQNNVIYATGAVTERASDGSPSPELAIDSSVLGGMYAGSIKIISNENGVGVKAPTTMAAHAGEMTITADGKLVMGTAQAKGNIKAKANGDIVVQNQIYSQAQVNLEAARDLIAEHNAQIVAESSVGVQAKNAVRLGTTSLVAANDGALTIDAGGAIALGNGANIVAANDVTISGQSLAGEGNQTIVAGMKGADGVQDRADMTIDIVDAAALASSEVFATGALSVIATTLDIGSDMIDPSRFVANDNIAITSDAISAQGATIASDKNFAIASNDIDLTDGQIVAQDQVEITARAGALNIEAGQIAAAKDVAIAADRLVSSARIIAEKGALSMHTNAGDLTNSGDLFAGDVIALASAGDLSNTGALTGVAAIDLTAANDLTNSGAVTTGGLLSLDAGARAGNSGAMLAMGVSIETNTLENTAMGSISGNQFVSIAASSNAVNAGEITSAGVTDSNDAVIAGTGNIIAAVDGTLRNSGTIDAIERLSVEANAFDNQSGGLVEGEAVYLTTASTFANAGTIKAGALLSVDVGTSLSNTGNISGNGYLQLVSANFKNRGTVSNFADPLDPDHGLLIKATGSFDNADGKIYSSQSTSLLINGPLTVTSLGSAQTEGMLSLANADGGYLSGLTVADGETLGNIGGLSIKTTGLNNAGAVYAADGNLTLNVRNNLTNSGVLYAGGDWMRLLVGGTVNNNSGAILANHNMLIAGKDFDGANGDRATALINQHEAIIETFNGNMWIYADTVENTNGVETVFDEQELPRTTHQIGGGSSGSFGDDSYNYDLIHTDKTVYTADVSDTGSKIVSAGSIDIGANKLKNSFSLISASENIILNVNAVANDFATNSYTEIETIEHWRFVDARWPKSNYHELRSREAATSIDVITDKFYSTIEAGGDIIGWVGDFTNGVEDSKSNLSASNASAPTLAGYTAPRASGFTNLVGANLGGLATASVGTSSSVDLSAIANSNLFTLSAPAVGGYLVESRYEFIDQGAFASSDYFMDAIGFDASQNQTRLGDAMVETYFIRDQLYDLTGATILNPGMSEKEQLDAMYQNAIDAARDHNLRPGVALTPAQQAKLTEDVIWLETQIINGQAVLVPTVYLANGGAQYASLGGGQIRAGGTINLQVDTLTNNGGAIIAGQQLIVNATKDIINNGGLLQGGANGTLIGPNGAVIDIPSITLTAGGDFKNFSGVVSGIDVQISATDIINETTKDRFGEGDNYTDIAGKTASIVASGDLSLMAINDITFTGADLSAGGNAVLVAGNDITFAALELESAYSASGSASGLFGGSSWEATGYNLEVATSSLEAGGNLIVIASDGNIVSIGAEMVAGTSSDDGTILLDAGENIVLGAAYSINEQSNASSSSAFFGLTAEANAGTKFALTRAGTSLGADSIVLMAGDASKDRAGNITLIGADLEATDSIRMVANGDIAILAAMDQSNFTESSSSRGFFKGGGDGFFSIYGGEGDRSASVQTTANGSSIVAGGDIDFQATGSLLAEVADVQSADDLTIDVDGSVLITGVANTRATGSDSDKWGLGYSFSSSGSGVSWFSGYQETAQGIDQTQVVYTGSNFVAGGDLTVTAGDNVAIAGSNLTAGAVQETINIGGIDYAYLAPTAEGGNLSVTSETGSVGVYALENFASTDESFSQTRIGVTASVSSSTLAGIQQLGQAKDTYGQGQGNLSVLNDASAIMMGTSGALKVAGNINEMHEGMDRRGAIDNAAKGLGVSVTVGFGFNTTNSSSSNDHSQLVSSSLQSFGGDVDINAEDDINIIASDVYADEDIALIAGDDVNILSGQEFYANDSSSDSFGAGITYNVLSQTVSVEANGSTAQNEGSGVNQVNAHVGAGNRLSIQSGGDTNIIGGIATGDTLDVDVGGDLTVASVQSTGTADGSGANFNFSIGENGGSIGIGGSDSASDYAWVGAQSALFALSDADIKVAGHTQLDGAIIGSATEDGLNFETGTFGHTDIFDNDEASDNNLNLSTGIGEGAGFTATTITGDLYNHDREQVNRATVTGGDVTITDEGAQAALANGTSPDAVDGVNYDVAAVNSDLAAAQEITKDDTNSATVYIDGAAIEEIVKGFPTVREAWKSIDEIFEKLALAELANRVQNSEDPEATMLDLLAQLEQCGTAQQTSSLWNFNWLLGTPAYASTECVVSVDGYSISIDDPRACAIALAKSVLLLVLSNDAKEDFAKGLLLGAGDQAAAIKEMLEDPRALVDALGEFIGAVQDDPSLLGEIANDVAQQMLADATNAMAALANGDYEEAGRLLSGLAIEVAAKIVTPGLGAALLGKKALSTFSKLSAKTPARTLDEIAPNGKIPSVRNGEFSKWFDDLTPEEFDLVWADPKMRDTIKDRIRHPGSQHEWCMVCRADDFKRWDVSMDEIQRFRTSTVNLKWIDPDTGASGGHGGTGSTKFHNELKDIIDNSTSLEDFNQGVHQLRDRWQIDPSLLPDLPASRS